jgi:ABC-type glycerol-3-phosphate transport system substrate-binding protein
MTKAMTLMQQLYRNGALTQITAFHFEHYNDVAQGRIALWVTDGFRNYNVSPEGTYDEKNPIIYEKDFPFKVEYAPLPLLASGAPTSMFSPMVGYYISSHTTQAKAAACWAWIQYLSGRPTIFGGYSPRPSVLPKESVGKDPEQFAVVQEAIQQYNTDAYIDFIDPNLWAYAGELGTPLGAAMNGGDITAALADAQRDSDAYRACMAQKDLTGLNGMQIWNLAYACSAPFAPPTPAP